MPVSHVGVRYVKVNTKRKPMIVFRMDSRRQEKYDAMKDRMKKRLEERKEKVN